MRCHVVYYPWLKAVLIKMEQTTLLRFAASGLPPTTPHALAEAKRKEHAERLGLPYPRPVHKRNPGKPSHQIQYEDILYSALRDCGWELLSSVESGRHPSGWRPGKPITPTLSEHAASEGLGIMEAAGEATAVAAAGPVEPPVGQAGSTDDPSFVDLFAGFKSDTDAEKDEQDQPKKRQKTEPPRQKVHVSTDAKAWFAEWSEHMVTQHGWSKLACMRQTQEWAPSVFAGIHRDTMFKWKPRPKAQAMGRPLSISGSVSQRLAVLTQQLAEAGTPLSIGILHELYSQTLRHEGFGGRISIEWTRRFVHQLGMKRLAASTSSKRKHSDEVRQANCLYLSGRHTVPLNPRKICCFGTW